MFEWSEGVVAKLGCSQLNWAVFVGRSHFDIEVATIGLTEADDTGDAYVQLSLQPLFATAFCCHSSEHFVYENPNQNHRSNNCKF